MSLISDNIIPGSNGRVFGTDAVEKKELECIKKRILGLDGIKSVELNLHIFPREFTVYTSKLVSVKDVEKQVKTTGFHAVPTKDFEV
ncbi:heavy-metal-associated domain-containing protein [Winogradskyella sp. A2]|uniref:heavy-metal-associated domain-containing protein n=1 Tax=Winogradskyella sp. A2 TaxID=3366944 RepID=UPI00398C3C13